MKKNQCIIIFFLVFLFTSCAYEFSEDYYNDIEITPATATLSLYDFENDIVLTEPVNVSYLYDGDNKHRLYNVNISVNDIEIFNSSNESGNFYIDVDNLEEGQYELKIEFYFSSGTGSLAEATNQEAYIATQEYLFTIDKSVGAPPNLLSVENIDGSLYVSWEILNHSDFKEAYLIIENESNQQLGEILLTEEQLNSGTYNDKLSLNNSLHYSIKLINNYTASTSNEVFINIPELSLEIEILNENQHLMRWGEHPLYNNFDHYLYSNYGYYNELLDSRGGELVFDSAPIFGESVYHYFHLYRNNQQVNSITKVMDFGKPFSTILASEYVYSTLSNSYYALKAEGESYSGAIQELFIHKLNPDDLSVIETIKLDDIQSSTFKNLTLDPISNNLIVDTQEKSYLINSSNLSIINSWQISDYNFSGYRKSPHYRNGYLIIANYTGNGNFSIFDAETKELVYSSGINYYFKISDDGRYFYNNDGIYELNNNEVNFVTSTDTGSFIHTITFLTDKNKCIYSNVYSNPVIFDFNTQSKTVLNEISEVNELQYDQSSGKVFFGQLHTSSYGGHKSFANIYSIDTQTFKRLEIYDSHYVGVYFRYLNDKLIFSNGLYLDTYINN